MAGNMQNKFNMHMLKQASLKVSLIKKEKPSNSYIYLLTLQINELILKKYKLINTEAFGNLCSNFTVQ